MLIYVLLPLILICAFFFSKRGRNLPPGPKGYPLVGNVGQVDFMNPNRTFRELRSTYGDVFSLRMGSTSFIVVNGREALTEFFIKRGDLTSDRPNSAITYLTKGLGIVGSSGEFWKEHRTFALGTFRGFGVGKRSIEKQILGEVESFLSEIDKQNGDPFNIAKIVKLSVSNVICSVSLGRRYEHSDKKFLRLLALLEEQFNTANLEVLNFLPFLRFLPGNLLGLQSIRKMFKEMDEFLDEIISHHRHTLDENDVRDYIDANLVEQRRQKNKEDSTFTDEQLRLTIRNFFIAGTETATSTITWTILFLLRHPEVWQKMRKELDDVIGSEVDPSVQFRSRLPYCQAVLTEGHRLSNVVPTALPHTAKESFNFGNYTIPKGAVLIGNLDSLANDPDLFQHPNKFDPERFLSGSGTFEGQEKFLPFSIGRRVCLGESLARMEVYLFILALVHKFDLHLAGNESELSNEDRPEVGFNPHPYLVTATRRA